MSDKNPNTVCIIGGGMSGLFIGALLAKNGYKVTVLEKNHIIGGGLQSFRRGDAVFNTGMQVFVGYGSNFALERLLNYVGISEQDLQPIPTDANAQEIIWVDDTHCYHLPRGRVAYEHYLISLFPQEKEGIHLFLDAIYEIGNTFDYFFLRPMQPHPEVIKYSSLTADQLIRQYLHDENLIKLIGYTSIHIGQNLSKAPAVELGMIMTLYIEGSWHLSGGNVKFAQLLKEAICSNGGELLSESEITKIHVIGQKVGWIETANGNRYKADVFISSISPHLLLTIADGDVFRPATKIRLNTYYNKFSGFAVFLKFKERAFPYSNSSVFIPLSQEDEVLPQYINLITPSAEHQDEWARTMEIYVPCRYSIFEQWENTFTGNRNDAQYENLKEELSQNIISYVARYIPELPTGIESVYVGTSLTLRDYYGNLKGETYSQQGLFVPIKTRMNNLFLTGQSVMYQGLFGVATTSIIASEIVLGRSLIEDIAKA